MQTGRARALPGANWAAFNSLDRGNEFPHSLEPQLSSPSSGQAAGPKGSY